MPPPEYITLTATQATDLLGTLDAVRKELRDSDKLGLIFDIEESSRLLIDLLFPDDQEGPP